MMSAAVGFVGVLRRAGPCRNKRVRVDACVGRLVLQELLCLELALVFPKEERVMQQV